MLLLQSQAATDESSGSDSDTDSRAGGKHRDVDNMPGDYPSADDLDTLLNSKMWTKVGGGSLAETGLAPPRLIREEERARYATPGQAGPSEDLAQGTTGSLPSLQTSMSSSQQDTLTPASCA